MIADEELFLSAKIQNSPILNVVISSRGGVSTSSECQKFLHLHLGDMFCSS